VAQSFVGEHEKHWGGLGCRKHDNNLHHSFEFQSIHQSLCSVEVDDPDFSPLQEIIFHEIFPKIFGQGTDVFTVISKLAFDMLVVSPFVCLPVAYLVKSDIFQYIIGEGLARYEDDVTKNGLLLKYWSIWGPVQCLTFPVHLRIAFIALISFFWLIIFSSITAKGQKERELECSLEDGMSCRIDG